MNTDKVKGAMDDVAGRAKRQAGEWTGDVNKQMDGAAQQVKGKAEKAWGNLKDAAHQGSQGSNDADGNRQSAPDRNHH